MSLDWLGVVRHGESTGNVAAEAAEAAGAEVVDIAERDADVPLSGTGRRQAAAVGAWLAGLPDDRRPETLMVSTYLRARQTAELAAAELATAGRPIAMIADERLRDRELGVLDLLTSHGIRTRLPDEARRRQRLGKFYYRPPGGESWADVALRLRGVLRELDGRVLVVAHEAIVFLLRYLIEGLDEAQVLGLARGTSIANGSVTSWRRAGRGLELEAFNHVGHLRREGAPATRQEDVGVEPY